jgi:hypothetical protein
MKCLSKGKRKGTLKAYEFENEEQALRSEMDAGVEKEFSYRLRFLECTVFMFGYRRISVLTYALSFIVDIRMVFRLFEVGCSHPELRHLT